MVNIHESIVLSTILLSTDENNLAVDVLSKKTDKYVINFVGMHYGSCNHSDKYVINFVSMQVVITVTSMSLNFVINY